jgi:hypothetical protein
MFEEQIFNLFEFFNTPDGKLWAIAFSFWIPSVALIVFLLNRNRRHPVPTWIALSSAVFLFSQTFPENRTQAKELGIGVFVGGGLLTWSLMRLFRKRKQLKTSHIAHADEK